MDETKWYVWYDENGAVLKTATFDLGNQLISYFYNRVSKMKKKKQQE